MTTIAAQLAAFVELHVADRGTTRAALVIAAGLASLAVMWRSRASICGSTLAAPWMWAIAALIATATVETAESLATLAGAPSLAAARFAAGLLALCPTVGILGAKRPQDRAWQFIVAAFWVVMFMPAARVLLLQPGAAIAPHAIPSGVMLIMIVMGMVNWIATRYGPSALFAAAGQFALIAPFVAPDAAWTNRIPSGIATGCFFVALMLVRFLPRRAAPSDAFERCWLDFRDQFGLFWTARVMSRLNAAAAAHQWPVRFRWQGVQFDRTDAAATVRGAIERSTSGLLRRFQKGTGIFSATAKSGK